MISVASKPMLSGSASVPYDMHKYAHLPAAGLESNPQSPLSGRAAHEMDSLTAIMHHPDESLLPISVYKETYQQWPPRTRPDNCRPATQYEPTPTGEDGPEHSSYYHDFQRDFEASRRNGDTERARPIRRLGEGLVFEPCCGPSDGVHSSYRTEFGTKRAFSPTRPFRPSNNHQSSTDAMETGTSYSEAFKRSRQFRLEPISDFRPRTEYELPTVAMATSSSYQGDYRKTRMALADRSLCIRPKNEFMALTSVNGLEELQSSYQGDFKGYRDSPKAEMVRQTDQLQLSKDQFSSQSDYKSQYATNAHKLASLRPPAFCPSKSYEPPSEPFSGITNYSAEFLRRNHLQSSRVEPMCRPDQISDLSHATSSTTVHPAIPMRRHAPSIDPLHTK